MTATTTQPGADDDDADQTLPDGSPLHWCNACEEMVPKQHETIFHTPTTCNVCGHPLNADGTHRTPSHAADHDNVIDIEEHRTELRDALRGARGQVIQAMGIVKKLRGDQVFDVELAEGIAGPAVLTALDQALVLLAGVQALCPDPVTPEV